MEREFSMADFRSKSYADGRTQMEGYGTRPGPTGLQDLRCYSASYASSSPTQVDPNPNKGKSSNGSSRSKSWSLTEPELQRKKRVVSYKAYTVEGKVKGSLRKSFRWIKDTCNVVVHGWR